MEQFYILLRIVASVEATVSVKNTSTKTRNSRHSCAIVTDIKAPDRDTETLFSAGVVDKIPTKIEPVADAHRSGEFHRLID